MFRHLHDAGKSARSRAEIDGHVRATARRQAIAAREAALEGPACCREADRPKQDGALSPLRVSLNKWARRRL